MPASDPLGHACGFTVAATCQVVGRRSVTWTSMAGLLSTLPAAVPAAAGAARQQQVVGCSLHSCPSRFFPRPSTLPAPFPSAASTQTGTS